MKQLPALVSLLVAVGSVTACSTASEEINCTPVRLPGIRLEVRDALTGGPAADGAAGFVLDGDYSEPMRSIKLPKHHPELWSRMEVAYERPGVYTVVVQKPGYQEWRQEGVRVEAGICHVNTVPLEVRLQPDR